MNPDKLQNGWLQGTVDGVEVRFRSAPAKILLHKDRKQHHVQLILTKPDVGESSIQKSTI
jgi:hypothetical protein